MCFEIITFLITSKERFTKLSFCLLCFMGVRFGAYEKTYSTDSVASISLAQRAQETEQRRALFNAETDAETT